MEGFGGLDEWLVGIDWVITKRLVHTWAYTIYIFSIISIVFLYRFAKYIVPAMKELIRKLRKKEKI